MTVCFVLDMLLQWGPTVLPPPLLLVLVHLPQETLDLFQMVWVQIAEVTTVGKQFSSVLILNVQHKTSILITSEMGTWDITSHLSLFFSLQLHPADPHFRFSSECNTTISVLSGRHGKHIIYMTSPHKKSAVRGKCDHECAALVLWLQTEEQALQRALEMSLADSRRPVQPALRWVWTSSKPIIPKISYYQLIVTPNTLVLLLRLELCVFLTYF